MKEYIIFKHPIGTIEAVKQGWSWPAFFFGSIWAIFKRLWIQGICVLIGSTIFANFLGIFLYWNISLIADISGENNAILIASLGIISFNMLFFIMFGIMGNKMRARNLESRGFEDVSSEYAETAEAAIGIYLTESEVIGSVGQGEASRDYFRRKNAKIFEKAINGGNGFYIFGACIILAVVISFFVFLFFNSKTNVDLQIEDKKTEKIIPSVEPSPIPSVEPSPKKEQEKVVNIKPIIADDPKDKIRWKRYEGWTIDKNGDGEGTLVYSDGNKYEGKIKSMNPHGKGVLEYKNGDKYVGQFKDGMRHGQGKFIPRIGNGYEGTFSEDKPIGQGYLMYPDGKAQKVVWKDGQYSYE